MRLALYETKLAEEFSRTGFELAIGNIFLPGSRSRLIILICFSIYAVTASLLTQFPRPENFIEYCRAETYTWPMNFLIEPTLHQLNDLPRRIQLALDLGRNFRWLIGNSVFLNIWLTVPLGLFLVLLYPNNTVVIFLCGIFISLLWEITQLTGVWLLAPCAWRTFDIGDLLTNSIGLTIGMLLGYGICGISRSIKSRLTTGQKHDQF